MDNPCRIYSGNPGPPCLMVLGRCLLCGREDEHNWASMAHEFYGLWAVKEKNAETT